MPEYDKMISDFMKQFEDETVEEETVSYPASEEIKEPVQAPDTIPERTNLQQNQGMQSSTVQSNGIVKKCAVEENPKSEIDRYQAA